MVAIVILVAPKCACMYTINATVWGQFWWAAKPTQLCAPYSAPHLVDEAENQKEKSEKTHGLN